MRQRLEAMRDFVMLDRLRTRLAKRRKKLLRKKIAFSGDADAQASADTMKNKTPTHSQIRSTGGA